MSEELDDVLACAAKDPSPLYLLWGEEFLVRKGADELIKKLLPDASSGINFFVMDGASPKELASELATLPMFPGRKVVLVRDPDFLAPKKGRGDGLAKARDAWKSGKRKEGARRILALVARAGWGVAELDPAASGAPSADDWKDELNVDLADADLEFLREVAQFCRDERITAPEGDLTPLTELFAKKLPNGHVLVLAGTDIDAKNPFVKFAGEQGRVVQRKVADRLKDLDLTEVIADVLKPYGKKLGRGATELLKDRVGANMRLLQSELEKLAMYANGSVIEAADVDLLVGRARDEEFFELSEAVQKRDLNAALRYVQDAMGHGAHGLMLLGAVASLVRNLLDARERLTQLGVRGPFRMTFTEYKAEIFPAIEREAKAAKGKAPHPWGAFLAAQATSRFGKDELLDAMVACAEADLALKSSAGGQLVIERLLFKVLQKSAA